MPINTMPGPEDIVLDLNSGRRPRLIVSCSKRRLFEENPIPDAPNHGFGYIDLTTDEFSEFNIVNQPEIELRPHGIDVVTINGEHFLYAISHKGGIDGHQQVVIKYKLEEEQLVYVDRFSDDLLISPNDIAVLPDGNFYCTNDSTKEWRPMRLLDQTFDWEAANVVFCEIRTTPGVGTSNWKVVAENLSFANGLYRRDNHLYVSCVNGTSLLKYVVNNDNTLTPAPGIPVVKGMDNLSPLGTNKITAAVHSNRIKFATHLLGLSHSPTMVYEINLETGEYIVKYGYDGSEISAGSTAVVYDGNMYISQVCESYVLKVPYRA